MCSDDDDDDEFFRDDEVPGARRVHLARVAVEAYAHFRVIREWIMFFFFFFKLSGGKNGYDIFSCLI